MEFDKPIVLPQDISKISTLFCREEVLESEYLGGVPNVTYKVFTKTKKLAIRVSNHGYTSPDHLFAEIEILKHLTESNFQISPKLVKGLNGQHLQDWMGYPVCATEYIPGKPGDKVKITSQLCFNVGHNVAKMQKALSTFGGNLPSKQTLSERGRMMMTHFPQRAKRIGWQLDFDKVISQWEAANDRFLVNANNINHQVVHSDVWPPNIICDGDELKGIIDFDDWCWGPTIIDLCAPLIEFPMYYVNEFNREFALNLLKGYFQAGGEISSIERELLINGLEVGCAMWLACNALHEVSYQESETYVYKLGLLSDSNYRIKFSTMIDELIIIAQENLNQNED